MGTQTPYDRRMPKARWTPDDEQKKLLAALKRAHTKVAAAEADYRKILTDCAEAEIPIAHLASEVNVERKTIYRHLGRSMT